MHRLHLAGSAGRPANVPDGPCLVRLAAMGLCHQGSDRRFAISQDGTQRHAIEVLKRTMPAFRTEVP